MFGGLPLLLWEVYVVAVVFNSVLAAVGDVVAVICQPFTAAGREQMCPEAAITRVRAEEEKARKSCPLAIKLA